MHLNFCTYKMIARRSNYCFLDRGVDRIGYLDTLASRPAYKITTG